jgi:hypothetical protein
MSCKVGRAQPGACRNAIAVIRGGMQEPHSLQSQIQQATQRAFERLAAAAALIRRVTYLQSY